MEKFITNVINNNYNSVLKSAKCSKPQARNIKKLGTQIMKKGTAVLNHLADESSHIPVEDQSEIHGNALQKVDLEKAVQEKILKKFLQELQENTVIAYDLTDEIHKYANPKKNGMEKISKVFDGSERSPKNGFTNHGVGTDKWLLRLDYHDHEEKCLPQVRKEILEELLQKFHGKGIFAFDCGNDDEKLFCYMNDKNAKFIVRLKSDTEKSRLLCLVKTGEILNAHDLPVGRHEVYVKISGKNKFDFTRKYWVIKAQPDKTRKPITLLFCAKMTIFSNKEIVKMYLKRWGVENQFRRIKQIYKFERMQVRKWQRRKNLMSLILLSHFLAKVIQEKFDQEKKKAESVFFIARNEMMAFLKRASKTYNDYSFMDFLRTKIPKRLCFFLRVKTTNTRSNTIQMTLYV
jgi:hypothetical protein